MSSISQYQTLKVEGSWVDRVKYVYSLSDKTELKQFLKQSAASSYDDLQMWVFLATMTKNSTDLLDIFRDESLPAQQRARAGGLWISLQKDPQQVQDFVVQSINDPRVPRYVKHQLVKAVHRASALRKSPAFFFNLICLLTKTVHHDQYNIDAHLLPFCQHDQVSTLLARWSITRLDQLDRSSPFYHRLLQHHPLVMVELIKNDLQEKRKDKDKVSSYFRENSQLLHSLIKQEAKAVVQLTIHYLKLLEIHERMLPEAVQSKMPYLFRVAPDEMIQLVAVVAAHQPGMIKYQSTWSNDGCNLSSFVLPRSFSTENYVRLFMTLYDTCKWSANHTVRVLDYMFDSSPTPTSLGALKKRRKWLVDTVINERIGKDAFLKKLLKEGTADTLDTLSGLPELTTPLSLHVLAQEERKGIVQASRRISLLRYQTMTQAVFDEFLALFKKTGSDVNQRVQNYPYLFTCALATGDEWTKKALQWIEKRFANEQLMVVEGFLSALRSSDARFQMEQLPENFASVRAIIDIAFNHLERSKDTLRTIITYGVELLESAERDLNAERRAKVQAFAIQLIKDAYSKDETVSISSSSVSRSCPQTRRILADILVADVLPTLVSKRMVYEILRVVRDIIEEAWREPEIDSFLNKFFTDSLPSTAKLQAAFQIDSHGGLISLFLENAATRVERVRYLLEKLDKAFFTDTTVQLVAVRSLHHRQLIDELVSDDKCATLEKLSNEDSRFVPNMTSTEATAPFPGLNLHVLTSCSHYLTGKQQTHIVKIIQSDYLQNKDVSNLDKLRSLRVLRRLTQTYDQTLQWIGGTGDSTLVVRSASSSRSRRSRGADVQPIEDIIVCLPATFDLPPTKLFEHFDRLKGILNAANAKYVSDAMLNISRKVPDALFLQKYLALVQADTFSTLGITANKEILRLLTQYVNEPGLVSSLIQPLWARRPHQDVRACLILTLFHFVGKDTSADSQTAIWNILRDATNDEYLPVIQSFFAAHRGESRWPLTRLKTTAKETFAAFVNQLQFQILDHPTSLEARSWAWSHIDDEHCDAPKLAEKAALICVRFDKEGNTLWKTALEKVLSCYKRQNRSSLDRIFEIMTKIMARREEIDSKENAIDSQHDLPVYHRVESFLALLTSQVDQTDLQESNAPIRSIVASVLQFDKTLAPVAGKLLLKTARSKEELEQAFDTLQQSLPERYFDHVLSQLSSTVGDQNACPFIRQLSVDEKLQMARWFVEEKKRASVVFDLLKNSVFNDAGADRGQCQNLLRQMRQSDDLFVRQQVMGYTVPWKDEADNEDNNDTDMNEEDDECARSDSAMS